MLKLACFTIASRNYLSYVRVLFDSLARTNPQFHRYLCLADVDDQTRPSVSGDFDVVQADALNIPNFEDFAFRYDIMEFNTAVKPYMFQWVFANSDVDAVIYLDPDIRCFSGLDAIAKLLEEGASVVATPHVTSPLEDGLRPNDSHLLQAGVFNLGFLAVARSREGNEFLGWWGRRMTKQCINSISDNLFVDQKWCDLLPCYVENLAVLRRPGFNVAYWNLSERSLAVDADGHVTCNGEPLAFFHFSGINPADPKTLSKHQNRHALSELPVVRQLVEDYIRDLKLAGWEETRSLSYAYGVFQNGVPVRDIMRKAYRRCFEPGEFQDGSPFQAGAEAICNRPAEDVQQKTGPNITRLMHEIFLIRPDVRAAFNFESAESRQRFMSWFQATAAIEYGLPDSVVHPANPTQAGEPAQFAPTAAPGATTTSQNKNVRTYRRLLIFEKAVVRHQKWIPGRLRERLKRYWKSYKAHLVEKL